MNDFLSKAPRPVSIASPADRELRSRRRSSTYQLLHYPQSSPQHKGAYFPKTLHGEKIITRGFTSQKLSTATITHPFRFEVGGVKIDPPSDGVIVSQIMTILH